MAKKVILKDQNNIEIMPITRGELILDSSGNEAFHSTEFLATDSQPGLMSAEDKYKIVNMQASSVANALTLKINNGSTEGTDLYTFNGSVAKTLNIVAGDNITLTPSAGAVFISANIPTTIDAYTKAESDARYLKLTGGTLTGNLGINGGTDVYKKITIGNETSGKYVLIHNSGGHIINDNNIGRIAELSLYESSSRLGGIGVYSGGPIYIDSANGIHKIALENITTITKTLVVSKDWVDTGIVFDPITFPQGNGSYVVQLSRDGAYFFTGYLSIVTSAHGAVTGEVSDEIILHGDGFDMTNQYYLRTVHDTTNKTIKLQIARSSTYTTSKTFTFKFKKLI